MPRIYSNHPGAYAPGPDVPKPTKDIAGAIGGLSEKDIERLIMLIQQRMATTPPMTQARPMPPPGQVSNYEQQLMQQGAGGMVPPGGQMSNQDIHRQQMMQAIAEREAEMKRNQMIMEQIGLIQRP